MTPHPHHLFTYTRTGDGPFTRLSPFQSEYFGKLQEIGFEVVSTSVLHDGTLLVTWRIEVDGHLDLDAAIAELEVRRKQAAAEHAIDDVVSDFDTDLLVHFMTDEPVPNEDD